ncbi:SUPPRESSOR OF GAMMA RESPONSE 1-like isoform X2 [Aristolochia californica]|uniref:SUPPRESSOR OF GAMMA RESPONSE 1-like isoform X2 n=1 Tax=Aristolochia californica TaxID=171875 RepID=UPI0035D63C97
MARSWLISSRGLAGKVKYATQASKHQIKEWSTDANRECPNCHHLIDNSDVATEWPGLPAGVKFDPSDIELLEHLEGKLGLRKTHMFIDEFIPTIKKDEGICYTHPKDLPGITEDGNCAHFFHRTSNAYATGHRKHRKIHGQHSSLGEQVRWHKTGVTKPVMQNGIQKGFKKIMVLYKSSKKCSKADKMNWKLHQYHLGTEENENEGEFVVSKIFYEQKQKPSTEEVDDNNVGSEEDENKGEILVSANPQQQQKQLIHKRDDNDLTHEDSALETVRYSPTTPKTNPPHPPRQGSYHLKDEFDEEEHQVFPTQVTENFSETLETQPATVNLKDDWVEPPWWVGKSQAVKEPILKKTQDLLLCNEILDAYPLEEPGLSNIPYFSEFDQQARDLNPMSGISDLDNIQLDSQLDFELSDLQFCSQESFSGWLDKI